MITLAIDFGSKNIGVALVQTQNGTNQPLFSGTVQFDRSIFKKKVEDRTQLRRLRRTRKTKKARMRKLEHQLLGLNLDPETVRFLIKFCKRRGYKSLFEDDLEPETEDRSEKEMTFRVTREEFFSSLGKVIERLLPAKKMKPALAICEKVLNRKGDRFKEIRPLRIENRGVSRCAWNGCDSVTPRRDNDLYSALAQFVYTVYASKVREDAGLKEKIDVMLGRLVEVRKRIRHAAGPNPEKEKKVLRKTITEDLKLLKDLSEPDAWEYNRKNINELLLKNRGRNRFCRKHSKEYIDYLLEGKPIPAKTTLTEKDLTSRCEEILFQKLWRYIQACVLPLAPHGVNRIVVERAAFDILAGTFKQRREVSDEKLEKFYQQGPKFNFKDDLEMLKTEFGGLCAYCGTASEQLIQREHLLPRSRFFFDSYLNIIPACSSCNQIMKNKFSMGEATLTIDKGAYEAYSRYVSRLNPPHLLHTIKKGILNRMTDSTRVLEAEGYLAMIARNFSQATETQKSPRPLARYLCEKIRRHYGKAPEEIAFRSGRHTDLWRRAAYPNFDKFKEKSEGGLINHALDAFLMGCDLPSPSLLEAKFLKPMDLSTWSQEVKEKVPPEGQDGVPVMPEYSFKVSEFNEQNSGGFLTADLSKMNWNRKDSKVQRQDAYGRHKREGAPVKRIAASELADGLRKADKLKSPEDRQAELKKWLDIISHPHLKKHLEQSNCGDSPGENTAIRLTEWLKKAIKGSMAKTVFSKHPVDQMRQKMLLSFMEGKDLAIPGVIGIRVFYREHDSQIDLNRIDPNTKQVIHHYYADPANRAIIVAYRKNNGRITRDHPLTLGLRQSGRVEPNIISLGTIPEGPLKGRCLGEPKPDSLQWNKALKEYLIKTHIAEYIFIHQGCVLCYEDGREKYIRNFASGYGFKKSLLKGIIGIKRSPLSRRMIPNEKLI